MKAFETRDPKVVRVACFETIQNWLHYTSHTSIFWIVLSWKNHKFKAIIPLQKMKEVDQIHFKYEFSGACQYNCVILICYCISNHINIQISWVTFFSPPLNISFLISHKSFHLFYKHCFFFQAQLLKRQGFFSALRSPSGCNLLHAASIRGENELVNYMINYVFTNYETVEHFVEKDWWYVFCELKTNVKLNNAGIKKYQYFIH